MRTSLKYTNNAAIEICGSRIFAYLISTLCLLVTWIVLALLVFLVLTVIGDVTFVDLIKDSILYHIVQCCNSSFIACLSLCHVLCEDLCLCQRLLAIIIYRFLKLAFQNSLNCADVSLEI